MYRRLNFLQVLSNVPDWTVSCIEAFKINFLAITFSFTWLHMYLCATEGNLFVGPRTGWIFPRKKKNLSKYLEVVPWRFKVWKQNGSPCPWRIWKIRVANVRIVNICWYYLNIFFFLLNLDQQYYLYFILSLIIT